MLSQTEHAAIKSFVKNTVGCVCPEEVFAAVEYHKNAAVSHAEPYSIKCLIGQRLLIYIVYYPTVFALQSLLPLMVKVGKRERDEKGLNRFRAVIVTEAKADLAPVAAGLFDELSGRDDNIHLHVIAADESKAMTCLTGYGCQHDVAD